MERHHQYPISMGESIGCSVRSIAPAVATDRAALL
jgi:hypothetical protein